jgi:starvation-inducible outer membrane lipoprotein
MKKIFSLLFLSFCFSFQAQKDTACVQIPKNLSINHEENWSILLNSSCNFKQELNFVVYSRWGNKLCEVKTLNDIKQFNFFKLDKNGQRIIQAGTCLWTLEYTIDGENTPRQLNGFINILD